MDNFGFFKVRAQVLTVKIADIDFNCQQILDAVKNAAIEKVDCMVCPELCLTGYTCADLFQQQLVSTAVEKAILKIANDTKDLDVLFAIGAPIEKNSKRYNCAVIFYSGEILGIVPKSYLPNYGEFYEKRWFESGLGITDQFVTLSDKKVNFGTDLIFCHKDVKIGVEICEDLWVPQPPSGNLALAGANLILNLSASDELIGKHDYLVSLIAQQSARCRCAYAYASAGWGESSTDLVFTGKAMIAEDGNVYGAENKFSIQPFSETRIVDIQKLMLDRKKFNTFSDSSALNLNYRYILADKKKNNPFREKKLQLTVDPYPFVPSNPGKLNQRCSEIIDIQSYGLMKRLHAINCKKAVVGISGGLDSTLALLVTVKAFDNLSLSREGIIAVTMPGLATSSRTKNNATALMKMLGVTALEIPIEYAVKVHFKDIHQDPNTFDATYENSQARERTQILMDLANKEGGIVIGTGDMSELALGWCTYNGDQMSMYGVNASIPKTLVKHLVNWVAHNSEPEIAEILNDICSTPISPELVPADNKEEIAQKTEDLVGPYELHDFFLYHFLRNSFDPLKIYFLAKIAFADKYDKSVILRWLKVFVRRFFTQQFKRSCMPDGPKVGSVNLSPRGDWRMPSDASYHLWLKELDNIDANG